MMRKPYGIYERFVKRPLDCVLSGMALLFLSPLMVVITLLVKIKLGSPVLFKQERPGKNGKVFKLYKFRSMTDEHGPDGELLPDAERLPSFGKKLRSTSLDELPELFNIFKGDMSIVGPRPLLVRYLPRYNERQQHRHDVRPGLTGLAQVNGRNEISWDNKLEIDVQYVERITFLGDIKIILKTALKVIKHDGITVECPEFMGTEDNK